MLKGEQKGRRRLLIIHRLTRGAWVLIRKAREPGVDISSSSVFLRSRFMFYIGGSWVGFLSQEVENVKHGCLEQKR